MVCRVAVRGGALDGCASWGVSWAIAVPAAFRGFDYREMLLELRPQLRAWCNAHMRAVRHFTFWGHPMVLYQRPTLRAGR